MGKIAKRSVSVLLSILMLISMLAVGVVSAGAFNISGDFYFDNTTTKWSKVYFIKVGNDGKYHSSSAMSLVSDTTYKYYFNQGSSWGGSYYFFSDTDLGTGSSPAYPSTMNYTKQLNANPSSSANMFVPSSATGTNIDGSWASESSYTEGGGTTSTDYDGTGDRVFLYTKNDYTNVYAHVWSGGTETSWPGNKATKIADKKYYYEETTGNKSIIFHNNSGVQSSDQTLNKNQVFYLSGNKVGSDKWYTTVQTPTVTADNSAKTLTINATSAIAAQIGENVQYTILDSEGTEVGTASAASGSDAVFNVPEANLTTGDNTFTVKATDGFVTKTATATITVSDTPTTPVTTYTMSATSDNANCTATVSPETVTAGSSATFSVTYDNTKYTFNGWYNGSTQVSTDESYVVTPTGNLSLTAKFTEKATEPTAPTTPTQNYYITGPATGGWPGSGGQWNTMTAESSTLYYYECSGSGAFKINIQDNWENGSTTLPAFWNPLKAGTSIGDEVNVTKTAGSDGDATLTNPNGYTVKIYLDTAAQTVYAVYGSTPTATYNVKVGTFGEVVGTASVSAKTVSAGGTVTFTAKNAGYAVFEGWYDSNTETATKLSSDNPYTYTAPTDLADGAKITLYAKFIKDENAFTIPYAKSGTLYVHAIADVNSNDTDGWSKVETYSGTNYFFLPTTADSSVIEIYNTYTSPVTVTGNGGSVTIPANGRATVGYTPNANITVSGATSKTIKVMKSSTEGAVYINNTDAAYGFTSDNPAGFWNWLASSKSNEAKNSTSAIATGTELTSATAKKIKGRGNTTWTGTNKKPFNITFSSSVTISGMTANKWSFLANYQDASLMRNRIIYDLSNNIGLPWSPDSRFVDFYVNGEYKGSYQASEKVEIGTGQMVDLTEPTADDSANPTNQNFIVEVDAGGEDTSDFALSGTKFRVVAKAPDPNDTGMAYMGEVMNQKYGALENALYNGDLNTLAGLIDMESLAKQYIIQELSKNSDGGLRSTYFTYNAAEDKFYAAPVWDFDITLGNLLNGRSYATQNPDGWITKTLTDGSLNPLGQAFNLTGSFTVGSTTYTSFEALVKDVWTNTVYPAAQAAASKISTYETSLADSAAMNYVVWPLPINGNSNDKGENITWLADMSSNSLGKNYDKTFAGTVDYAADWMAARTTWMNSQLSTGDTPTPTGDVTIFVGGPQDWGTKVDSVYINGVRNQSTVSLGDFTPSDDIGSLTIYKLTVPADAQFLIGNDAKWDSTGTKDGTSYFTPEEGKLYYIKSGDVVGTVDATKITAFTATPVGGTAATEINADFNSTVTLNSTLSSQYSSYKNAVRVDYYIGTNKIASSGNAASTNVTASLALTEANGFADNTSYSVKAVVTDGNYEIEYPNVVTINVGTPTPVTARDYYLVGYNDVWAIDPAYKLTETGTDTGIYTITIDNFDARKTFKFVGVESGITDLGGEGWPNAKYQLPMQGEGDFTGEDSKGTAFSSYSGQKVLFTLDTNTHKFTISDEPGTVQAKDIYIVGPINKTSDADGWGIFNKLVYDKDLGCYIYTPGEATGQFKITKGTAAADKDDREFWPADDGNGNVSGKVEVGGNVELVYNKYDAYKDHNANLTAVSDKIYVYLNETETAVTKVTTQPPVVSHEPPKTLTLKVGNTTVANGGTVSVPSGSAIELTATATGGTNLLHFDFIMQQLDAEGSVVAERTIASQETNGSYSTTVTYSVPTQTVAETPYKLTVKAYSIDPEAEQSTGLGTSAENPLITEANITATKLDTEKVYFDASILNDTEYGDGVVTLTVGGRNVTMILDPDLGSIAAEKKVYVGYVTQAELSQEMTFNVGTTSNTAPAPGAAGYIFTIDAINGNMWGSYDTGTTPTGSIDFKTDYDTVTSKDKVKYIFFDNSTTKWKEVWIYSWNMGLAQTVQMKKLVNLPADDPNYEDVVRGRDIYYYELTNAQLSAWYNQEGGFLFLDRSGNGTKTAFGKAYMQSVDIKDTTAESIWTGENNVKAEIRAKDYTTTLSNPTYSFVGKFNESFEKSAIDDIKYPFFQVSEYNVINDAETANNFKYRANINSVTNFYDPSATLYSANITFYIDAHAPYLTNTRLYRDVMEEVPGKKYNFSFATKYADLKSASTDGHSKVYSTAFQVPYTIDANGNPDKIVAKFSIAAGALQDSSPDYYGGSDTELLIKIDKKAIETGEVWINLVPENVAQDDDFEIIGYEHSSTNFSATTGGQILTEAATAQHPAYPSVTVSDAGYVGTDVYSTGLGQVEADGTFTLIYAYQNPDYADLLTAKDIRYNSKTNFADGAAADYKFDGWYKDNALILAPYDEDLDMNQVINYSAVSAEPAKVVATYSLKSDDSTYTSYFIVTKAMQNKGWNLNTLFLKALATRETSTGDITEILTPTVEVADYSTVSGIKYSIDGTIYKLTYKGYVDKIRFYMTSDEAGAESESNTLTTRNLNVSGGVRDNSVYYITDMGTSTAAPTAQGWYSLTYSRTFQYLNEKVRYVDGKTYTSADCTTVTRENVYVSARLADIYPKVDSKYNTYTWSAEDSTRLISAAATIAPSSVQARKYTVKIDNENAKNSQAAKDAANKIMVYGISALPIENSQATDSGVPYYANNAKLNNEVATYVDQDTIKAQYAYAVWLNAPAKVTTADVEKTFICWYDVDNNEIISYNNSYKFVVTQSASIIPVYSDNTAVDVNANGAARVHSPSYETYVDGGVDKVKMIYNLQYLVPEKTSNTKFYVRYYVSDTEVTDFTGVTWTKQGVELTNKVNAQNTVNYVLKTKVYADDGTVNGKYYYVQPYIQVDGKNIEGNITYASPANISAQ